MHDAKFAESPQSPRRMNYSTGRFVTGFNQICKVLPWRTWPGFTHFTCEPGSRGNPASFIFNTRCSLKVELKISDTCM